MANRRYDESQNDERNRARYERDDGGRRYEHTTAWRPRDYDQSRARDDGAEERFRAGSRWDQDRRDFERAPGRAHNDYSGQDYGRRDYGQQDRGNAYGFVRHERSYDDETRTRNDDGWRDRVEQGGFRESAGYPPRSYDPGMYAAFPSQGRDEPGARGFRGHGPKDYKRSDDRIREDVCDRLADADSVDARGISVEVGSGEVTLNGHVSSRQAKRAAEDAIEHCSGVHHIQNNLRIRESGDEVASDKTPLADTGKSRSKGA